MTDAANAFNHHHQPHANSSNGSDGAASLSPDWLVTLPDWEDAIEKWGTAWDVHLIVFSSLFLLQVLLAVCLSLGFCKKVFGIPLIR